MAGKYVDVSANMQVIGTVFKNPDLFDNENYTFTEEDFPLEFHKIVFGTIYNLHQLGANDITISAIEDYLSQRPKKMAIYNSNKGSEYLTKLQDAVQISTFQYYYNRMKKMTLLRLYSEKAGMDLSWLYDINNLLDLKKKQAQEDFIDNSSLEDLADLIDNKINKIRRQCVGKDNSSQSAMMGDGGKEFKERLKKSPQFGLPLYGDYINTVTRGARLGKFFLRSAATGVGKSRTMIADACHLGCTHMYDFITDSWISIGKATPVLYIATEQDLEECQTMCWAFLSGVNEEHILQNTYLPGEEERVDKAIEILSKSKIYFECIPDFSLQDIENTVKRHIKENQVFYIFFDYIHSSMKILEEITRRSGGIKLREDNILFMLSTKLKDICVQHGAFILSSTQLNADYKESETPDQNLLRGAKSIADRIDWGSILLDVTQTDIEKLKPILAKSGMETPNVKMSIYKNRQGRWRAIYLFMKADKGTCRFNPIFATDYNYKYIEMENYKIKVKEESAF